jgi:hypothetical protein
MPGFAATDAQLWEAMHTGTETTHDQKCDIAFQPKQSMSLKAMITSFLSHGWL